MARLPLCEQLSAANTHHSVRDAIWSQEGHNSGRAARSHEWCNGGQIKVFPSSWNEIYYRVHYC